MGQTTDIYMHGEIPFNVPSRLTSRPASHGRDVCRDLGTFAGISPCMYISLICPIPFIWKEFCRDVFRPVPAKRDPGSVASVPSWSAASFRGFLCAKIFTLGSLIFYTIRLRNVFLWFWLIKSNKKNTSLLYISAFHFLSWKL